MPSINMIAPRRAEKKRLESNIRRLVVVIFAEVLLIACVAGLFISRIYSTHGMIQDLEIQLTKLEPDVKRINDYDKAIQDLKPKLDTLNAAKSDTLRWCRILDDLGTSLPAKTWLVRISTPPTQPTDTNIVVNMNGVSASQELVGETMLRMHDIVEDFDKVDLHFTQKATGGLQTAVEFEIAASMKLPEKTSGEEVKKS